MEIPDMTTDIKRTPRNQNAIDLMATVTTKIKDSPEATEVFILVKIGGDYVRFSSGVDNLMHLVATLELAKFDALQRMSQD
jgi:hypothetical protein